MFFLVQLVDLDDPSDQQIISRMIRISYDSTLARVIGFYNIYHQMWALIE